MPEQDEATVVEVETPETSGTALLFELEYVAVKGRAVAYEVVAGAMSDRDAELTPDLFSRYCIHPKPAFYASKLLEATGKQRSSSEKFTDEVSKSIQLALGDGTVQLDKGFSAILKKAVDEKMAIGALTSLDEETALALMERLGLKDLDIALYAYSTEGLPAPAADAWRKLAKLVQVPPTMCATLSSSHDAFRSALLGGMRCVVVPDSYTQFQDFSGADVVTSELTVEVLDQMLEMVNL